MRKCIIDTCDNQAHAKGLCKKHYAQHLRGTLTDKSRTTEDIIADIRRYESYIDKLMQLDNQKLVELLTLIQELINH